MKIFLVFLLLISLPSYGAINARVMLVKGKVTKLLPGKKQADKVKMGDVLPQDSSIHTKAKSFVLLKFSDGTRMNIGPKSKLVVAKLRPKKASMVKLLNGIVKAEVQKRTNTGKPKVKLYVKTRSATMGVRGTKFQTTFNGKNATTSLVTIEGKVAMKKNQDENLNETETTSDEMDELDKSFDEAEDLVEVPEGKYSGVNPNVQKPVEPVKIAPQQYNALAATMNSKKKAKDVMKLDKAELKSTDGLRSGGYVDFSSGLYIPPPATAKIDKKTGTYKATAVGKVNKKTGDYIPPQGIKVDPVKGLVVDRKELAKVASKDERLKILKTVKAVKKEEAPLVVNQVEKKPKKTEPKKNYFSWLPDDHVLSAKYIPYSEKLVIKDLQTGQSDESKTSNADFFLMTWKQNWNKKWFTRITMGDQTYKPDVDGLSRYRGDDTGEIFIIGVGRNIGQKWTVTFDIVDRQMFYIVPGGPSNFESRNTHIGYFDLGVRYNFYNASKMKFLALASLYMIGDERAPSKFGEEEGDYSGLSLGLEGQWMWSKTLGIFPSLRYERIDTETSTLEFERSNLGLGLDFIWDV